MNTANLQLEGLLMALAAVNRALVDKNVLSMAELDHALAMAEQIVLGEDRVTEDLSPANRDAIVFPIRLLRAANGPTGEAAPPSFAELARTVGETKGRHNDQF